jgi:hypothetical protein
MYNPFKRIRCQCIFCGHVWRIPQGRILRFEKLFDIKKVQPFVWECHDCHQGAVIPGTYINIHGEIVKIDPKNLIQTLKLCVFDHYSIVPAFHVGGIKPLTLKDA